MTAPRTTLEQWRALQAVVEHGGFAAAAEYLNRSQSSVSYLAGKLQEQLGVKLLTTEGRRAKLTEAGEVLLQRSRLVLSDVQNLEQMASAMRRGWEAEIRLVVDAAFPTALLMRVLSAFAPVSRGTRVQLNEVVLSGADEALLEGRADLLIAAHVPSGFMGDPIAEIEFVAVAHPDHPLHQLDTPLTLHDLSRELQVVIRDSGVRIKRDIGWLGAEQRWTVTNIETSVAAIVHGLGFGWLPLHQIRDKLDEGTLKPLPLEQGQKRLAHLYLIYARPDNVGPATQALARLFHDHSPLTPPHDATSAAHRQ